MEARAISTDINLDIAGLRAEAAQRGKPEVLAADNNCLLIAHLTTIHDIHIAIMSETMFAKAILSNLDKRPIKLGSDHVSDPRKYPAQSPVSLSSVASSA